MTHYFAWKNNPWREARYRHPCRVLAEGRMNSILIQFADGSRAVTSRNAVRLGPPPPVKAKAVKNEQPGLF